MHTISKSAVFLVLGVLATACSGSASAPLSPSGAAGTAALTSQSVAGSWRLVAVQASSGAEQAAPSGSTYTMTLGDDRASLTVDCNVCGGAAAVTGDSMTIGPRLACTLAACPTMAFGNDYLGVLAGDSAARLVGTTLELTSARGTVRFTR
jgi:heat shock protein HslJ